MTAPRKPSFAAKFKGGETLTNENGFSEFYAFAPRADGLTDAQYAAELANLGLAFPMTTEEIRDIALYKEAMKSARADGIPVIIVTAERQFEVPTPEKTAADWLAEARANR